MKTIVTAFTIILLVVGCAHSPDRVKVQDKIAAFDEIDEFTAWFEDQPGIENVKVNRQILLTSMPPQVIVRYDQNGINQKMLLQVAENRKLKVEKPE